MISSQNLSHSAHHKGVELCDPKRHLETLEFFLVYTHTIHVWYIVYSPLHLVVFNGKIWQMSGNIPVPWMRHGICDLLDTSCFFQPKFHTDFRHKTSSWSWSTYKKNHQKPISKLYQKHQKLIAVTELITKIHPKIVHPPLSNNEHPKDPAGGWFQPIWKNMSQIWKSSQNKGEN